MLFIYNKNLGIVSLIINCVGKIIRIDEPIPISIFGIATEFTEIEEHEKEAINTSVEEALEQANKTSLA